MAPSGWTFGGQPATVGHAVVTLIQGTSFCICTVDGEMDEETAQGMFFRDTRIVSGWSIRLNGQHIEHLSTAMAKPFRASFLGRARPDEQHSECTILVQRERYVGAGLREDISLRNLGREPAHCTLSICVAADFADLFEVKERRVTHSGEHSVEVMDGELYLTRRWQNERRGVRVSASGAHIAPHALTFDTVVHAGEIWETGVEVHPMIDGKEPPSLFPRERPVDQSLPARWAREWRQSSPVVVRTGSEPLLSTLRRSRIDLGALRIFDPERLDEPVIAAGAPWFMTLFGRDSILSSLMALPIDPNLALGTLRTLARYQGNKVDPTSEEEPGRILHEIHFGADASLALGGSSIYYGTADATPLFVILLHELHRWGTDRDHVLALMPHADRALEWVTRYGDRDGDGLVEYRRASTRGLVNQGWKDSWDGINFADGRIAEAPIALCEVQGYACAAYLARANLARDLGSPTDAQSYEKRAAELKTIFNEKFWLPDKSWYAVGLDKDKHQIDALASNMGHCLWTGIVDDDKAPRVAEQLISDAMFSGWGVRTLASTMGAYNPMSYHNGSVWPHDNAIIAAGLMRYGFVHEAQSVVGTILDAAAAFGHRLPELWCGFDRSEFPLPVP